ncbi:MAG: hypothetical protein K8I00_12190 [Candidatus Omnitrophica bacterium]|nr:hypothetical protein [Candidatus Omnitrophota bacterium]
MKLMTLLFLSLVTLTVSGCGQNEPPAPEKQDRAGFGSAISGMFGQTDDEKALHQAQRDKIISLKETQKELQKARTEAVLSTRQEGDPVTP